MTTKSERLKKLVVFPNDPIKAYYEKGEIKPRYFNPGNFFDEVHIISLCREEVEEEKVHEIVGDAQLKIYTVQSPFSLKAPFLFFKRQKIILELLKHIRPDAIRAYNSQLAGYLAAYYGKKLGVPSVLSLHTNFDEYRKYDSNTTIKKLLWLLSKKIYEPYSLSNISKTICVSNFLTSYACNYGAKDIEVIHNKVYTKQFSINRVYNEPKNKLNIVSVGRLDPPKNQECLIRAIVDLDVNLTLIGNGRSYEKLNSLVKQLNAQKKVKIIKSVPNKQIQEYYWQADIFAISSFFEGFCIPVLEAMASALPVVVNNKEPLPEVLGGTGIVVENTPEAFEQAFKRLLSDPLLRKELGEKARRRALEIDGEIMEKKEADLYRKLVVKS